MYVCLFVCLHVCKHVFTFAFLLFVVATGFPQFIVTNDFNGGHLELMTGDTVVELGTDSEGMHKKPICVTSYRVTVL